jgi:ribonuclease P protein component
MLPAINQLNKQKEIDKVFKLGKRLKGDFFYIKIIKTKNKNSRFCFIVSKKISKKAVVRNKIKRRLRDIIRKILLDMEIGADIIVCASPGIEKKNYKGIEKSVNSLLKIYKIIK